MIGYEPPKTPMEKVMGAVRKRYENVVSGIAAAIEPKETEMVEERKPKPEPEVREQGQIPNDNIIVIEPALFRMSKRQRDAIRQHVRSA